MLAATRRRTPPTPMLRAATWRRTRTLDAAARHRVAGWRSAGSGRLALARRSVSPVSPRNIHAAPRGVPATRPRNVRTRRRAPIALQYATARFADGHDSADPAYQRKIAEEDALRSQPATEDVGDRDIPYEDRDPYASTGGYQPEEYKCADYDCAEYKSVYDK